MATPEQFSVDYRRASFFAIDAHWFDRRGYRDEARELFGLASREYERVGDIPMSNDMARLAKCGASFENGWQDQFHWSIRDKWPMGGKQWVVGLLPGKILKANTRLGGVMGVRHGNT